MSSEYNMPGLGPLNRRLYQMFVRYFQTGIIPSHFDLVQAGLFKKLMKKLKLLRDHPDINCTNDLFQMLASKMRLSQKFRDTLESATTGGRMVPVEDVVTKVIQVHTRGGLDGPGHRGVNNTVNEVKKLFSVGERHFGISEAEVKRIVQNCPDERCIRKMWLIKLNTGTWPESKPKYYQERTVGPRRVSDSDSGGNAEQPSSEYQRPKDNALDLTVIPDKPLDLSFSRGDHTENERFPSSATQQRTHGCSSQLEESHPNKKLRLSASDYIAYCARQACLSAQSGVSEIRTTQGFNEYGPTKAAESKSRNIAFTQSKDSGEYELGLVPQKMSSEATEKTEDLPVFENTEERYRKNNDNTKKQCQQDKDLHDICAFLKKQPAVFDKLFESVDPFKHVTNMTHPSITETNIATKTLENSTHIGTGISDEEKSWNKATQSHKAAFGIAGCIKTSEADSQPGEKSKLVEIGDAKCLRNYFSDEGHIRSPLDEEGMSEEKDEGEKGIEVAIDVDEKQADAGNAQDVIVIEDTPPSSPDQTLPACKPPEKRLSPEQAVRGVAQVAFGEVINLIHSMRPYILPVMVNDRSCELQEILKNKIDEALGLIRFAAPPNVDGFGIEAISEGADENKVH